MSRKLLIPVVLIVMLGAVLWAVMGPRVALQQVEKPQTGQEGMEHATEEAQPAGAPAIPGPRLFCGCIYVSYKHGVDSLELSADGTELCAIVRLDGYDRKALDIRDFPSGEFRSRLLENADIVYARSLADGDTVAVVLDGEQDPDAGSTYLFQFWDWRERTLLSSHRMAMGAGEDTEVRELAISPDGRQAAVAVYYYQAYVWDIRGERRIRDLPGMIWGLERVWPDTTLYSPAAMAFSPDGHYLALSTDMNTEIGPAPGEYILLDAATWEPVIDVKVDSPDYLRATCGVAFSPDSQMLAVAMDSCVILRRCSDGSLIGEVPITAQKVAFSPDGATLVGLHVYNAYTFWDLGAKAVTRTLRLGDGGEFALSPDGRTLIHDSLCLHPLEDE